VISLRQRVTRWLVPPILLLLLVNAWYGQRSARETVNRAYDRGLLSSAHLIAERTYSNHGEVIVDLPYSALDVLGDGANERVFYGVFWPDGEVITGYEDLPRLPPSTQDTVAADAVYRGEPVRMVVVRKKLYDPEQLNASSVLVVMAETVDARTALSKELFYDGLRSQALLVVVGILLIWVTITRALNPLTRLGQAFARRRDDDLTPVHTTGIPAEVKPLIDAVNHHMERIEAMLQARKRFVADAAHQLRTPLAVLRTQIDYGLRQQDATEMHRALEGLGHSVRHTQRLTNQLLSLSSAEAINGLTRDRAPVDLVALARDVAFDLSPLAVARHIDLGFEADTLSASQRTVMGHEPSLRELCVNLLDNALRYTPAGGSVTVAVTPAELGAAGAGSVSLSVSDTGPGIPMAERDKVFHRFYRILGHAQVEGSGLGLAIVREIAHAHGARVALADAPTGQGLQVRVTLPCQPLDGLAVEPAPQLSR
jgi:two-component system sensor histidine kinase TctE